MTVLTASWCCSVGSTWAIVLRKPGPTTEAGPVVTWLTSGVPITEPAPDLLAHRLLAERGFRLFLDAEDPQRTHSVRRLGFVFCMPT
jgi:hypothetical protein